MCIQIKTCEKFVCYDTQPPHNSDLQRRRPRLDTVDEMREMCFPSNHIGVIAVPQRCFAIEETQQISLIQTHLESLIAAALLLEPLDRKSVV